jgi:D-glycero-alpha-D-manno-heptose 1-phosphate guanylyltransferase
MLPVRMNREAVILAGGLGTRLRGVVSDVPKSMAPVNGRPFLEYQLGYLAKWGVRRVIMASGYKGDVILGHFKDHFRGTTIIHSIEKEPLGTGGAIKLALRLAVGPDVFVLNGDTFFDINLEGMAELHRTSGAHMTVALRMVEDVARFGSVVLDADDRIRGFREKNDKSGGGFINGGVYLFGKAFFDSLNLPDKCSFEKDLLEKYYDRYRFAGMKSSSYFIDIGIPQDYERAQEEFRHIVF